MLASLFGEIGKNILQDVLGKELLGAQIGQILGRKLGKLIEDSLTNSNIDLYHHQKTIENIYIQSNSYGKAIPVIFGQCRLSGNIIWADSIKEEQHESLKQEGGKTHHNIEYNYFASFAIALCKGRIDNISTIWANNNVIDISKYNYRIYHGSSDQLPDPLISSFYKEYVPAFRDIAYIVFEKLPLTDFDNKIPNFSFEITRKSERQIEKDTIDLMENIIIIPGSGEFVCDTDVVSKANLSNNKPINSHNNLQISDAEYSLQQLMHNAKNLKWISFVVCWFIDGMNIRSKVLPCVEFCDDNTILTKEWYVQNFKRTNARIIKRDIEGSPLYGGTMSDDAVCNYLKLAKKLGLKIMFYPMFLVDEQSKPWRGRLTGTYDEIATFFNQDEGYNDFILHYANLTKDYIDAFLVGSELIGLTKVCNNTNDFVGVNCLINLARKVKNILGDKILVSYAADWSEYHHTDGGWYNLDKLWADDSIDFIGIDCYFPLTQSSISDISTEDIIKGWYSCEGYDYYLEHNNRHQLTPEFAWKNIEYWWGSDHYNPDSTKTSWKPKSKPIWFTELGYPSIDKATNQPNVFFNPECIDGGSPKYSTSEVDFSIQQKALDTALKVFQNSEIIEKIFIWTFDMRPYPAWPHIPNWKDGALWERGHWIQNKIAGVQLSNIFSELLERFGVNLNIENCKVNKIIQGIIFNDNSTIFDYLMKLKNFFNFNVTSYIDVSLTPNGNFNVYKLNQGDLIYIKNSPALPLAINIANIDSGKIAINYISKEDQYNSKYAISNNFDNASDSNHISKTLNLNLVTSASEAVQIANKISNDIINNAKEFSLCLSLLYFEIKPGDRIILNYDNQIYKIKITKVTIVDLFIYIVGQEWL